MAHYNHEHYPDETAWKAMQNVAREFQPHGFRPLVFVCSPYAGDTEANVLNARRYCSFAVRQGCIPIAPHIIFPQFLNDRNRMERDLAIYMGLVLMGKCHEVWVFGNRITEGMSREIVEAKSKMKKIRYFSKGLQEVTKNA